MVPEELLQARLDVGWHRRERVGMWAIEVRNPITQALVAMKVEPLHHFPDLVTLLIRSTSEQRAILLDLFDPHPFP